MSLFNLPVEHKCKNVHSTHPWEKSIKHHYADMIKQVHNSVGNEVYPKPKKKIPNEKRTTFTVIGNRMSKQFIYCVKLVLGMHKYRWKDYDTPIIKACTQVEWPEIWRQIWSEIKLKNRYVKCRKNVQVAVFRNGNLLGNEKELKDLIESKYIYYLALDYQKESVKYFSNYIKSSGRPCAYMHISIEGKPIGSLIFMLYSDVVPVTCENFLRLCRAKRGGYSGTPIHRVVKDGWIQGGGFGLKNTEMDCENFIVPHDRRGVLGMANAGRHIDCSTQFYVLLQPNEQLTHLFVAFGQLIDGEETLKKIEEVETYYEAPTSTIIIDNAGVLNLDCQDIRINKNAMAYLSEHIDDLITIGEMFYELIIEHVFTEIEFRKRQLWERKDNNLTPNNTDSIGVNEETPNNKGSTGVNEETLNHTDSTGVNEETSNNTDNTGVNEEIPNNTGSTGVNEEFEKFNNDCHVDVYEYECVSRKTRITPTQESATKVTKPYYIPFTDVPYPGEIDSDFDLKRLLRGDYCLEADLNRKLSKEAAVEKIAETYKLDAIRNIIDDNQSLDLSFPEAALVLKRKKKVKDHSSIFTEDISFSGKQVKNIAKHIFKTNPILKGLKECFNDEDIRKIRVALRSERGRKVLESKMRSKSRSRAFRPRNKSTTSFARLRILEEESEDEDDEEIKRKIMNRRPTGFVKPSDLRAISQSFAIVDDDEESEEDDDDKEMKRKIMNRRPTGFVKPSDLRAISQSFAIVAEEEDLEEEDKEDEIQRKLLHRRPTGYVKPTDLDRLLSQADVDEEKELEEEEEDAKKENEEYNRDEEKVKKVTDEVKRPMEKRIPLSDARKNSESAGGRKSKDLDMLGRKMNQSLHNVFTRNLSRTTITVEQYRKMNDEREKKLEEKLKHRLHKILPAPKSLTGTIRMPGDTPLYSPSSLSLSHFDNKENI